LEAGKLRFAYAKYGKPELSQDQNGTNVRFNLAHSHGLALFAFTRGREIGVDLEFIQPGRATDEIAQRFFSPVETAGLRSLPQEDRVRGFFDCWTRKEAFIKARGLGLYMALDKFAVTLAPGEKPALLSSEDDPEAPKRWSLCGLNAAEGYAAALAVEGQTWNLRFWTGD